MKILELEEANEELLSKVANLDAIENENNEPRGKEVAKEEEERALESKKILKFH